MIDVRMGKEGWWLVPLRILETMALGRGTAAAQWDSVLWPSEQRPSFYAEDVVKRVWVEVEVRGQREWL
jgi:hypothetical protein